MRYLAIVLLLFVGFSAFGQEKLMKLGKLGKKEGSRGNDAEKVLREAKPRRQRKSLDILNETDHGVFKLSSKKQETKATLNDEPAWDGSAISVKFIPGFFWNTPGIELEFPMGENLSFAVNGFYKFGRTDGENANLKLRQNDALNNGYLAEGHLRYYFKGSPFKFYAQAMVGYGNTYYADGSVRPFSLSGNIGPFKGLNNLSEPLKTNPLRVGLGGGYQWILSSRGLVVNCGFGIHNHTSEEGTHFTFYLQPSIGFIF